MLNSSDFERLWGTSLSSIDDRISSRKFDFDYMTSSELQLEINNIKKYIQSDLKVSGPKRIDDWENGWSENLDEYYKRPKIESLIPKYFGKDPILRFKNNLIKANSPTVEYMFFETLMDYISIRFLSKYDNIFEFGCGTSHNLIRLRTLFESVNLIGLDWTDSSVELGSSLLSEFEISNLKFNFFEPDLSIKAPQKSCALTVAALEQVGTNFTRFIDYLLLNNFERVVHIEPINELLDESLELDKLSIEYSRKRNYLDGLLNYLRKLENAGRLKIIFSDRSHIGSHYIDGYSIVVWEKV